MKIASKMFSIKKEELFLLLMGILFFESFLFFYGKNIDFPLFLQKEIEAFSAGLIWFAGFIAAFLFYFIFKVLFAVPKILKTGDSDPKNILAVYNWKTGVKFDFFDFFKTVFLVLLVFSFFMFALAGVSMAVKERLLNQEFFDFENKVFAGLPFIFLHNPNNFYYPILKFLTPAIIWCFQSLSLMMGITLFLFYLIFNKEDYYKYIFSMFIGSLIALPFWYLFPINSPNNFYLSQNPKISNYHPIKEVVDLQEQIHQDQKNNPPISTFPSMHTVWAICMVYYLGRNYKKTLFFSIPWLILLIIGTTYLAQHYFLDVLLAIPIAILSIISANIIQNSFNKKSLT